MKKFTLAFIAILLVLLCSCGILYSNEIVIDDASHACMGQDITKQ